MGCATLNRRMKGRGLLMEEEEGGRQRAQMGRHVMGHNNILGGTHGIHVRAMSRHEWSESPVMKTHYHDRTL